MDYFDRDWNREENWIGKNCRGFLHVVEKGDTLYKISRKYRVPLARILLANPYVDIYNLQVGDEICVPKMRRARQGMDTANQEQPDWGVVGRMPSGNIGARIPSIQRNGDEEAMGRRNSDDRRSEDDRSRESRRPIERMDAVAEENQGMDDRDDVPKEELEERMEEETVMHGCHYEIE